MWGTIARMQLKPDVPEAYLVAQLSAFSTDRMSGMVNATLYRSDGDPRELWMVAMFEDEEAYKENAESSVQQAIFLSDDSCMPRARSRVARRRSRHEHGRSRAGLGGPQHEGFGGVRDGRRTALSPHRNAGFAAA